MRDALGAVQSVLVLGGTSEIALATVRQLVAQRCRRVVLAGRDVAALEAGAESLRSAGATRVEAVAFDALDTSSHRKVLGDAFGAAGGGDVDLVLVAFGVLGDQGTFDDDPEAAAEAVRVNYVGTVSAGLAAAQALKAQGHGTIVFLSSVAGERARRDNYVYGSSKAGVDAFAQGLGDALVGTGVRVLVVRPGFVHTRMTAGMDPAPFSTTPDAVATQILRGLQKGSEVVWAPPLLRVVFSGLRHLPRPLWRKVSAR
jgi:decaprenylphospho-beta-D-erythro-pentofuranosid-2-ulose 2-reductase